ncbi:PAS domain-containing protein [Methylobacterium sp. J-048]|uniref:HWE histidine kinase domain-containing protein n=1 Tax=Methylobacterium sp. J-048 TaxID=2836635 RepID=UPI001FBAF771|nr:HWE histidine kinase domain-containing protein [Methylobacterium sp. J-048]MCJ2060607.1 PAS domain-containing protein [Methylobacterium sp. J-048]
MTHGVDRGPTSNVVPLRAGGVPSSEATDARYRLDLPAGEAEDNPYDPWNAWNLGRELICASQDCVEVIDQLGHLRLRNPMARRILGDGDLADADHEPWSMSWPPAIRETVSDALAVAATVGTARFDGCRPAAQGGTVYWDVVLSRIVNVDGRLVGVMAVSRDMTQLRRIEDGHDLRSRELSHRLKNMFALVNGLVTLSARNLPAVQSYAGTLRDRFTAMSRALEYLQVPQVDERSSRPQQTLQGLLGALLRPYDEAGGAERRFVHGAMDDVLVGDGSVTGLALVIHELATNAIKHGALAGDGGTVTVDCRRVGADMRIAWTERGGPRIGNPPSSEGFGSKLTERTVRGQLSGSITHHWDEAGLRVVIGLPWASLAS